MPASTDRVKYDIDDTYQIDYNLQNQQWRFALNQAGPASWIDLVNTDDITSTPAITTYCIFFDPAAGSDTTGDGTILKPYETPLKAANATTSSKPFAAVIGVVDLDLSGLTAGITSAYFQGFIQYHSASVSRYLAYELGYTPSDVNTIYIKKTGSDGANGNYATPKLTMDAALAACIGALTHIIILDSESYDMSGFTFDGSCVGIYAYPGTTPAIRILQSAANTTATATPSGSAVVEEDVTTSSTAVLANGHVVHAYLKSGGVYLMITSQDGSTVYVEETEVDRDFDTVRSACVARVSDDKFVITWVSGNGTLLYPYRGKMQIWTEDIAAPYDLTPAFKNLLGGSAPKSFYTGAATYGTELLDCACYVNSVGNIIIVYQKDDYSVCYQIRDVQNAVVKSHTDANLYKGYAAGVLSDDSFVIAGHCGTTGGDLAKIGFFICDDIGVKQLPTGANYTEVTDSANVQGIGVAVFEDDDFGIIFSDSDNSDALAWSIYNVNGVYQRVGSSSSSSPYLSSNPLKVINGDLAMVIYCTSDFYIKMAFLGVDGICYASDVSVATSDSGGLYLASIGVNDNDGHFCVYNDTNAYLVSAELAISIYWDGINVTSAAEIRGVTIDGDDQPYLYRMVNATAAFTRKWCEIIGVSYINTYMGIFGLTLASTAAVVLKNNLVHDNAGGDYVVNNSAEIEDNDYYRQIKAYCACVTGAGSGVIVRHNDMADSVGALRLIGNNGSEIVENNVMYDNDVNDTVADTEISITYGDLTGESVGVSLGAKVISASPLFLNDGKNDPSATDHRLMVSGMGDYADSPALRSGAASDGLRDIGCYDVRIMDVVSSCSTATISKPRKGISVQYEYVGKSQSQMMDGSYRTDYEAMSEKITVEHDGIENDEFEDLLDAITHRGDYNGMIRWYGNPTTAPTVYIEANILYENLTGSAATYKLTQSGRQKVKYVIGRKITF